jgi:hypothetical protein
LAVALMCAAPFAAAAAPAAPAAPCTAGCCCPRCSICCCSCLPRCPRCSTPTHSPPLPHPPPRLFCVLPAAPGVTERCALLLRSCYGGQLALLRDAPAPFMLSVVVLGCHHNTTQLGLHPFCSSPTTIITWIARLPTRKISSTVSFQRPLNEFTRVSESVCVE